MRGMGKFTEGHWIKSRIFLILPVGEPLKPYLLPYIMFDTRPGPQLKWPILPTFKPSIAQGFLVEDSNIGLTVAVVWTTFGI